MAAKTLPGFILVLAALALGACGELRNPFAKEKPFTPTPYPKDFAVVIDESPDTYYARQNIHQVVTAADLMSRTTYTTFSDYNNSVVSSFTQEQPVTESQMQAMWNEVTKNDLLEGATVWYFWKTNPDNYMRNERRIQVRAQGQLAEFKVLNHWGYRIRDLEFLIRAGRLPITQHAAATTQP